MIQLNLAQTAILKFIENKDLTTKRTSFTGKWAKYSYRLQEWVLTSPKWLTLGADARSIDYNNETIIVKWTDKTITICRQPMATKAHIVPRTMEYCVDAPTTYGDATMRHS
jgi:hypothetical protein